MDPELWDKMTSKERREAVAEVAALPHRERHCARCDLQVAAYPDQGGKPLGAVLSGHPVCVDCKMALRMEALR